MMPPVQMRAARSSKAARRFAAMPGSFLLGQITTGAGSGVPLGAGGVPRFFPFGHPPFLALRRAALALASEVARPPRRPSACAALFIDEFGFGSRSNPRDDFGGFRLGVFDGGFAASSVDVGLAIRFLDDAGDGLAVEGDDVGVSGFGRGVHFVFWLFVGLISFDTGHNSEPLGYCKRKVKFLLGGGGGSENLHRHSAKKNDGTQRARGPEDVR